MFCHEGSRVKHYPVAGLVPDSLFEHVTLGTSHAWVQPNAADQACTEKKQIPRQHNLGKHLQINCRAVDLVTFAVHNLPKQLLHLLLVQVLFEGVYVDAQNALPLSFLQA